MATLVRSARAHKLAMVRFVLLVALVLALVMLIGALLFYAPGSKQDIEHSALLLAILPVNPWRNKI